jgi:hypothetical protein
MKRSRSSRRALVGIIVLSDLKMVTRLSGSGSAPIPLTIISYPVFNAPSFIEIGQIGLLEAKGRRLALLA